MTLAARCWTSRSFRMEESPSTVAGAGRSVASLGDFTLTPDEDYEEPEAGGRLVTPESYIRRVTTAIRLLDEEILQRQQRRQELLAYTAQVQDTRCQCPGCKVPPMLPSKWCPLHRREHMKEQARERQRRHRQKMISSKGSVVALEH